MTTSATNAQIQLWVGEPYSCFLEDCANKRYDWINIKWNINSNLYNLFSGNYVNKICFNRYSSSTANVTVEWTETIMSDPNDPFRHKSYTWSFVCKDNPLILNNEAISVVEGHQEKIDYKFTYQNTYTSNASMTFSSSDKNVATVNSSGVVTAINPGTAKITVYSSISCEPRYCMVTVRNNPDIVKVTDIKLDTTYIKLRKIGMTKQLIATILPANASNKNITWESTNEKVATIDNQGLITAHNIGTTNIFCRSSENKNVYKGCFVEVTDGYKDGEILISTTDNVYMRFQVVNAEKKTCKVIAIARNYSGAITIPSKFEDLNVVEIGDYAFSDCVYLTKVSIPSTIIKIGRGAFSDCTSLEHVIGISSLEYIGDNAFERTPWIKNMPEGLLYIGKVLYKHKGTMKGKSDIVVHDGTTQICGGAFEDQDSLVSITIPSTVKYLESAIFSGCSNLQSIKIDAENPIYDSRENCNAVIETATDKLVTGCESTIIPNSVKIIGEYAMSQVPIQSLKIPDSVDSICSHAFWNAYFLKDIQIGKGARKIMDDTFGRCFFLKTISVSPENPYFDSRNDCNAIIETSTNKLIIGCQQTIIPETVNIIGKKAFATSYSGMQYLNIPDNVYEVEDNAFEGLENLNAITFGQNINKLGEHILYDCTQLKKIHVIANTPPLIQKTTFDLNSTNKDHIYENAILYVPNGSIINYKCSEGWYKFKNIIEDNGLSIKEHKINKEKANIYDINGRKLNGTKKGINIINGKKIIIR